MTTLHIKTTEDGFRKHGSQILQAAVNFIFIDGRHSNPDVVIETGDAIIRLS